MLRSAVVELALAQVLAVSQPLAVFYTRGRPASSIFQSRKLDQEFSVVCVLRSVPARGHELPAVVPVAFREDRR